MSLEFSKMVRGQLMVVRGAGGFVIVGFVVALANRHPHWPQVVMLSISLALIYAILRPVMRDMQATIVGLEIGERRAAKLKANVAYVQELQASGAPPSVLRREGRRVLKESLGIEIEDLEADDE
jgi:hypothetical protein